MVRILTKVVRFHRHGGPDVLQIEDAEPTAPGPGEVQIRVKAIGLNRAEALMRAGTYIETPPLPSRLGFEAAGVVEATGDGVTGFSPGDAVSLVPPVTMLRWPTYGEVITFPAALAVKHPPSLGWEQAASLWMAYLTAYGALIETAKLQRGEFVVITAPSSSVGLAAIQIANHIGAVPIAVARTNAKAQALRAHGAAHIIAVDGEDIAARLGEIAGVNGVRVVFDAVGGPIFTPLTQAMARGGILLEYGGLSSEPTPFPLFDVLTKVLTLRGYLVHEITADVAKREAAVAFILDGVRSGAFRPAIAKTFAFGDIVAAHRYLESNEQFGKVVVTV